MSKNKQSIRDTVIQVVGEQLGIEVDSIREEQSFIQDLGADSLDTVELIMALEDQFEIEIPDNDAEKILTVADAINYATKIVEAQ